MTVGGRTALELQGYAHYLSQQLKEVHLYGVKRPPGWLIKLQRLSVDINLTYLPVAPRSESLAAITAAMERIAQRIESSIPGARITFGRAENAMTKLVVRADSV